MVRGSGGQHAKQTRAIGRRWRRRVLLRPTISLHPFHHLNPAVRFNKTRRRWKGELQPRVGPGPTHPLAPTVTVITYTIAADRWLLTGSPSSSIIDRLDRLHEQRCLLSHALPFPPAIFIELKIEIILLISMERRTFWRRRSDRRHAAVDSG